jgi:hypothetical protein
MTKIKTQIAAILAKIKAFIIEEEKQLPVGLAEFHTWADNIIAKSGAFADIDSMKFALATLILHADHAMASAKDSYFVNRLRKSAANQVASQVFQDIKAKQAAQQQAANQVVTTPTETTSEQKADTQTATS